MGAWVLKKDVNVDPASSGYEFKSFSFLRILFSLRSWLSIFAINYWDVSLRKYIDISNSLSSNCTCLASTNLIIVNKNTNVTSTTCEWTQYWLKFTSDKTYSTNTFLSQSPVTAQQLLAENTLKWSLHNPSKKNCVPISDFRWNVDNPNPKICCLLTSGGNNVNSRAKIPDFEQTHLVVIVLIGSVRQLEISQLYVNVVISATAHFVVQVSSLLLFKLVLCSCLKLITTGCNSNWLGNKIKLMTCE